MRLTGRIAVSALLGLALSVAAQAAVIGNWSGSNRTWNDASMATLKSTLAGRGHTIAANADLSGLSEYDALVIGEPGSAPGAADLGLLAEWVNGGGTLILMAESGGSGVPALNTITSSLGSSLTFSSDYADIAPLAGGTPFTEGPPFNIVGQTLTTSPGSSVAGSTALAGTYVAYQSLGSGFVFGFADRLDHDYFEPSADNTNGQLFINIIEATGETRPSEVPEPTTMALMAAGLGAVALLKRR
jgi:hypothetical protein